jgi:hypothetical protein
MKRIATALVSLFIFLSYATAQNPISWTFSLEDNGNGEISLIAKATIEPGWHLYDTEIPEGGPTPTTLTIDKLKGAEPIGKFHAEGTKPHVAFDPVFGMQIGTFDGSVRFVQRFKITDRAEFVLEGDVRAQACNEQTCTPPLPVDFAFTSGDLPETVASSADNKTPVATPQPPLTEDTLPATDSAGVATPVAPITTGHAEIDKNPLWTPVIEELKAYGMEGNVSEMSLWWIFISGFIGGIIALLTPCVWPMIPMTVSFFLKRNAASRKKAVSQAIVYGVAIIAIYLTLGLLITAIFGASALNNLATSAVFNLIFFALLVLFAISFFWRLRPGAARFVDQQNGFESRIGFRNTQHLFHGIYAGAGIVFVHRAHHRDTVGRGCHMGEHPLAHHRHVRLCTGTGHSLRSVCHFPLVAANHAEIGRLAERRKNSPRFLGTGFCIEVFIGCRSGLRMGHSRQGSIPRALDRNLCTAWHVPTRQTQISPRQRGRTRFDSPLVFGHFFVCLCHLSGARTVGCTAQSNQRFLAADVYAGFQFIRRRSAPQIYRLRKRYGLRKTSREAGTARFLGIRMRELPQNGSIGMDRPPRKKHYRQRIRFNHFGS